MPFPKILSLVASATFLAVFVFAGDQCYYLDGQPAGGVYRCDNTTSGESSCCNAGQICYSNGVCQAGPENKATDWLRVGCTDKTWSSPACLKQCTSLVPESSAGIRPCGGILLSDQYCCDTEGKGPGSLACCSNSSNIFAIDPIPSIIATIPLNPTKAVSSPSSGAAGSSSKPSSSSSNILIPISTVSSTLTALSASSTTTSFASSDIPSSSYYFTSSNSTAKSTASSTSTPGSTSTKPAAATTTSSLASRFDSLGVGVSFGIAMLGGLVCAF